MHQHILYKAKLRNNVNSLGYVLIKYCVNYALCMNFAEFSIARKGATEGFLEERPRPKEEKEEKETTAAIEKIYVK